MGQSMQQSWSSDPKVQNSTRFWVCHGRIFERSNPMPNRSEVTLPLAPSSTHSPPPWPELEQVAWLSPGPKGKGFWFFENILENIAGTWRYEFTSHPISKFWLGRDAKSAHSFSKSASCSSDCSLSLRTSGFDVCIYICGSYKMNVYDTNWYHMSYLFEVPWIHEPIMKYIPH